MAKGKLPRSKSTKNPSRRDFITFYPAWCKKCGICVAFCPKNVLEAGPDGHPVAARPEDCIRCHLCELRCPDFAVSVADEAGEEGA